MTFKRKVEQFEAQFEAICKAVKDYDLLLYTSAGKPIGSAVDRSAADQEIEAKFGKLALNYGIFNGELKKSNKLAFKISDQILGSLITLANTSSIPIFIKKLYRDDSLAKFITEQLEKLKLQL